MTARKLLLGTRKGLILYEKQTQGWQFAGDHFLGIPESLAARDRHSGTWWALLDHGHWGCKLHRSRDAGATWQELQAPQYPEGAKLKEDQDATLKYLWAFASDPQGRIYIGTEPGGLFYSDDIVYRRALDIAGDTLAFGTTTGNLYLSEDRGESWVCLNQNLPMVYSLEFV